MSKPMDIMNKKQVHVTLSFNELVAIKAGVIMGRMWTPDEDKNHIRNVYDRICKYLEKHGVGKETLDSLKDF